MTTFTTNTDLNARGTQMLKARETAETQVWRMVDLLPALFTRMAPHPMATKLWRRPRAARPRVAASTTCCADQSGTPAARRASPIMRCCSGWR
jgi:hypothetical protein